MKNKRKNILIAIGGIILVLLLIIIFWPHGGASLPTQNGSPSVSNNQTPAPQKSTTVAPVPANVVIPNEGDKSAPSGVAVPNIQTSAHPSGGSSQYRQFPISANNNTFVPATIAVNVGDIIDLEITAVDKDYDFTQPDYGFSSLSIQKGTTKKVQFQAVSSGKFTFYCSSCGGPSNGPVGYIIIK